MAQKFQKDSKGSVIDPPVIPEYERRLIDAHNVGDQDLINEVQGEYEKERNKRAGVSSSSSPSRRSSGSRSASSDKAKPKTNEGGK